MKKIMIILSTFLLLSCGSTEEKKEEKVITRKTVLTKQAKKETLARLKSPSTAIFIDSLIRFKQIPREDNPQVMSNDYAVFISVDAQNSYGATIRNHYTLVYTDNGKDSLSANNYNLKYFWD